MPSTTGPPVFAGTGLSKSSLDALARRVESPNVRTRIAVRAPMTDEEIGTVPALDSEHVDRAVERARNAQAEWETVPIETRAAVLERFGDIVENHRDELLDIIQLETGKTRSDAQEEILDVPLTCSYYASEGPAAVAEEKRNSAIPLATDATVTYDPVGVVGVISPWNYPLTLSMTDTIPALLAGNAVVCKPDERTPYIGLALAALFEEAGLPEDIFQVVTGEGATVGPALVDAVDYIAFTGGTETGRAVAQQAGQNLIDCSLELGGKNPMVVLGDADVDEAARGAVVGAFTNAGQLCLAPERIYVHEDLYDDFLDAFVARTRQLQLGLEFEYGPDVGSLIDGNHLEHVDEHVEDAVSSGASLLTGGRARPDVGPFCYEPTILTDVGPDARLSCEETFGPVVSVTPVSGVEDAVERANDSEYGLNASVWTGDRSRGRNVAGRIDCGTVCVNDAYAAGWAAVDAPMGGFGDSGLGRRHGPEGIRRFLESRTVATSRMGAFGPPEGVPAGFSAWFLQRLAGIQRRLVRWL